MDTDLYGELITILPDNLVRIVYIVDYGVSNIRSVQNAVHFLGYTSIVVADGQSLAAGNPNTPIILPGVGRFGPAMSELHVRDLSSVLIDRASLDRTPILGICLGFQLLMSSSAESVSEPGLGLIPIDVLPLAECGWTGPVPRVGFDTVQITTNCADSPVLGAGFSTRMDTYFCHSYGISSSNLGVTLTSGPGGALGAAVELQNIFGTQFHPEKSQYTGIRMLQQFLQWSYSER